VGAEDSVFVFGVQEANALSRRELDAGYAVGDVRDEAAVKRGVADCLADSDRLTRS